MNGSIIVVWFVVCVGIMVFAFAYFPMAAVTLAIIDAGMLMPNMPPQALVTMNIYCNSLIWSAIMFLFGVIGYAFISSRRKEYLEYER